LGLVKSSKLEEEVFSYLAKAKKPAIDKGFKESRDPLIQSMISIAHESFKHSIDWINQYIHEILSGKKEAKLFKASTWLDRPLSKNEIKAIQESVRERYEYVAATMETQDFIPSKETIAKWKKMGIIDKKMSPTDFLAANQEGKLVRNAFLFGRMQLAIEQGGRSYQDVLKIALNLPLTKPDKAAIAVAEQQTANYITSFGETMANSIGEALREKNRDIVRQMAVDYHKKKLMATVMRPDAPVRAVSGWKEFSSELYHKMEGKGQDWDRIAFYELNDAKRQGKGISLLKQYGGDQLVYKTPMPTACPQCKELYLENGVPKLFRLGEMMEAGSNIGKKPMPVKSGVVVSTVRPDKAPPLLPVAGLVHPYCECEGPSVFTGLEWWADKVEKP
jgi:hypothetical protein